MKALCLVLVFWFSSNLLAQADVQSLNQKLNNENAGWTARENAISRLSEEEFRQMLGGPTEEIPLVRAEEQGTYGTLPAALDWRNRGGSNWVGPVRNQGQCGSCVAFASIAAFEIQYKIDAGKPGLNLRLSPQHLFSCGGGSCYWGWTGDGAARYLKNSGVPDDACFPYTSGSTGRTGSCSSTCGDYKRRSVRLSAYSKPTSGTVNIDVIKQALQYGPVVAMFNVYDDFRYFGKGIYRHVSGKFLSGHALPIVGYNDKQRYFIVRNSWGTSWGEKGFGRISYDDTSGLGSSTWSYRANVAADWTSSFEGPR